ncbi:MAG TPA: hypothetical protein VKT24_05360 [Rhizomicrobium sp.]|nr:hypothetical protein [Rhizomicrobium sp.]
MPDFRSREDLRRDSGLSPEQAMGYHMGNAGLLRLSMGTEALFGH